MQPLFPTSYFQNLQQIVSLGNKMRHFKYLVLAAWQHKPHLQKDLSIGLSETGLHKFSMFQHTPLTELVWLHFSEIVYLYKFIYHFSRVSMVLKRNRSSHRRCSARKGILRNFAKLTGKHLCQSLFFNKVTGRHRCFSVDFTKFLRTPFLTEHL